METRKRCIGFLLVFCLALTGCTMTFQSPVMPKPADSVLEGFQPSIADLNNRFGFDLYARLLDGDKNLLISPASVAMALAMTYNGADAETREAMARVLQIQGIDLDTLNRNNLALLYFLRTADPKVRLDFANSIWMREGLSFDPDFLARNKEFYLAGLETLDFEREDAAGVINAWVKKNTRGLIEDIVKPPIKPLTIMFLINTIYFQGTWSEPFNKNATTDEPFHLGAGGTVTVPLMRRTGEYGYLETAGFQAVRLPYGEGRMAMYVFLPSPELGLKGFEESLNWENWESWLSGFQKLSGTVRLPRFNLEYEAQLNGALTALGMGIAFDPDRANFNNMVAGVPPANIYIREVKHKTHIKLDEAGTEAAGATSVEMAFKSMPLEDFVMKVDRPFFYAIQDEETGAILFLGSVHDPR